MRCFTDGCGNEATHMRVYDIRPARESGGEWEVESHWCCACVDRLDSEQRGDQILDLVVMARWRQPVGGVGESAPSFIEVLSETPHAEQVISPCFAPCGDVRCREGGGCLRARGLRPIGLSG